MGFDEPFARENSYLGDNADYNMTMCSNGEVLALKLGHLPLALSIAAAFMRQCDISCREYIRKLSRAGPQGGNKDSVSLPGYPMGVEDSLMLSVNRIQGGKNASDNCQQDKLKELVGNIELGLLSPGVMLKTLSYLYPDNISKSLVKNIVMCLLLCRRDCYETRTTVRQIQKSHSGNEASSNVETVMDSSKLVKISAIGDAGGQYSRKKDVAAAVRRGGSDNILIYIVHDIHTVYTAYI